MDTWSCNVSVKFFHKFETGFCLHVKHVLDLRHQDLHNQAIYMVFGSTRWFGLRVDLLCVPFLTCVALASVAFSMDPGKSFQ